MNPMRTPALLLLPLLLLVSAVLAGVGSDRAVAAKANPKAEAAGEEGPSRVAFGVYVLSIHNVDVSDDSYGASLFVWWRYDDPDFNPLRDTQFLNARQLRYENITDRQLDDNSFYVGAMAHAVITERWDISRYPFDRHRLTLVVETPLAADDLVLELDEADSGLAADALPPRWRMTDFRLVGSVNSYPSGFGRPEPVGTGFSRTTVVVDIVRDNAALLLGRFIGFFAAAVIAGLMYVVRPIDFGPRIGLAVCAVLSAIGNTFMLQSEFGHWTGIALSRQIAVITFVAIVVAIANAVATARCQETGREVAALRINRWVGIAASALYFGALAVMLLAAGTGDGGWSV